MYNFHLEILFSQQTHLKSDSSKPMIQALIGHTQDF